MEMVLIRHGLSEANAVHRMAGHADSPLTEEGIRKIHQLKTTDIYPEVEGFYVSDLKRAVQTAQIIYPDEEVNFQITKELREINFGSLEDTYLDKNQASQFYSDFMNDNLTTGGEQYSDFQKRINRVLYAIFTDTMQNQYSSIAIIAHYGVLRAILVSLELLSEKLFFHDPIPNGMGYRIRTLESGRPVFLEELGSRENQLSYVG